MEKQYDDETIGNIEWGKLGSEKTCMQDYEHLPMSWRRRRVTVVVLCRWVAPLSLLEGTLCRYWQISSGGEVEQRFRQLLASCSSRLGRKGGCVRACV